MGFAVPRRRVTDASGTPGPQGLPGRGVNAAALVPDAEQRRLVLGYTDGSTRDVGDVRGQRGEAGPAGPQGRGVAGVTSGSRQVVIHLTDGSTISVPLVTLLGLTS